MKQLERLASKAEKEQKVQEAKVKKVTHALHTVMSQNICNVNLMFVESIGTTESKQGDHLSGKPGNVWEFGTCQGNVRDVVNSQGNVSEKILSWKSVPKLFLQKQCIATYTHSDFILRNH